MKLSARNRLKGRIVAVTKWQTTAQVRMITAMSVVVAVPTSGIEGLGRIGDRRHR
jgi:molybdopterin-binding protein